jgi:hypothetical protein
VLCRNRDYGSFEVRVDCKIDEVTKEHCDVVDE